MTHTRPDVLGPWDDGPDGQRLVFLACADGEKIRVFVGPFYVEASIAIDLAHTPCERGHFRTERLPAGAWVEESRWYRTIAEETFAQSWVSGWDEALWPPVRAEVEAVDREAAVGSGNPAVPPSASAPISSPAAPPPGEDAAAPEPLPPGTGAAAAIWGAS